MGRTGVTVDATLQPDGTLRVAERVDLPPGPVRVTVEPLAPVDDEGEDILDVLREIWASRAARGATRRTREEINAEISAIRDASEEEIREIEGLGRLDQGGGPTDC